MKKSSVLITILLCVLLMFSCAKPDALISDEVSGEVSDSENEYSHITINVDWPYYANAQAIADASTNVFFGTVTNISFKVLDMTADNSGENMLYTVYTVMPYKNVKGLTSGTARIAVIGGIAGYREDEQYYELSKSGLTEKYSGIPIPAGSEHRQISEGGQYLFCTSHGIDGSSGDTAALNGYLHAINMT